MIRSKVDLLHTFALVALLAALVSAGCATAVTPAPEKLSPRGRLLIEPSLGYQESAPAAAQKTLSEGWSEFRGTLIDRAEDTFLDLIRNYAAYGPGILGLAAVAIERGDLQRAESLVEQAIETAGEWAAAVAYRAEIAAALGDLHKSWQLYDSIAGQPGLPGIVSQRRGEVAALLFEEQMNLARATTDSAARVPLLEQALLVRPDSLPARILLVESLTATGELERARRELQSLIDLGHADLNQVQAALAEIEIARGDYRAAIQRYERLVTRTGDQVYERRLNLAKQRWQESNLPAHYRRARDSAALTRAQLATLLYWKVGAVRFAQNPRQPPIAVDVADIPGREEFIRALALGLFSVDRITREASPTLMINEATFLEVSGRLLTSVGQLPCSQTSSDPVQVLHACGVDAGTVGSSPRSFVTGAAASQILEQIDERLE